MEMGSRKMIESALLLVLTTVAMATADTWPSVPNLRPPDGYPYPVGNPTWIMAALYPVTNMTHYNQKFHPKTINPSLYTQRTQQVGVTEEQDTQNLESGNYNLEMEADNIIKIPLSGDSADSNIDCDECIITDITDNYIIMRKKQPSLPGPQGPPFKPAAKCKLSLNEVENIVQMLQNQNTQVPEINEAAMPSADKCEEAMSAIKQLVASLVSKSKELNELNKNNVTLEAYQRLKNDCAEKLDKAYGLMENLKREAEQESSELVDKMVTAQHNFKMRTNELLNELSKEISKRQNDLILLIAYAIRSGEMTNAKVKFMDVTDKNKITDIIKHAYDSSSQIDRIIAFTTHINKRGVDVQAKACETLVEVIINRGDIGTPLVLVLNEFIDVLIRTNDASVFDSAKTKLRPAVRVVLKNWTRQMIDGHFGTIAGFCNLRLSVLEYYWKDIIATIIRSGKDDLEAKNLLMDLTEELHNPLAEKINNQLFEMMQTNGDTSLVLAMRIAYKEYRMNGEMSSLFKKFPEVWLRVFKGDELSIDNARYRFPMYVESPYNGDGYVYATRDKCNTQIVWGTYRLRMDTVDNGRTWRIRTDRDNNYLYEGSESSNGERTISSLAEGGKDPGRKGAWELQAVDRWDVPLFSIRNKDSNYYVNAAQGPYQGTALFCRQLKLPMWTEKEKGLNSDWTFSDY